MRPLEQAARAVAMAKDAFVLESGANPIDITIDSDVFDSIYLDAHEGAGRGPIVTDVRRRYGIPLASGAYGLNFIIIQGVRLCRHVPRSIPNDPMPCLGECGAFLAPQGMCAVCVKRVEASKLSSDVALLARGARVERDDIVAWLDPAFADLAARIREGEHHKK